MPTLYDFKARSIDGEEMSLSGLRGRAVLVVNVASQCGLTPQYAKLQALYEKYRARGFDVLGFPCNQFAGQEPGAEREIRSFCETHYGVTFPLFSKIEVNGPGAHPLYAWLKAETGSKEIAWNFEKFLVGKDGTVRARFSPRTAPDAPEVVRAIEDELAR